MDEQRLCETIQDDGGICGMPVSWTVFDTRPTLRGFAPNQEFVCQEHMDEKRSYWERWGYEIRGLPSGR